MLASLLTSFHCTIIVLLKMQHRLTLTTTENLDIQLKRQCENECSVLIIYYIFFSHAYMHSHVNVWGVGRLIVNIICICTGILLSHVWRGIINVSVCVCLCVCVCVSFVWFLLHSCIAIMHAYTCYEFVQITCYKCTCTVYYCVYMYDIGFYC